MSLRGRKAIAISSMRKQGLSPAQRGIVSFFPITGRCSWVSEACRSIPFALCDKGIHSG
jgi:hypothetical protein